HPESEEFFYERHSDQHQAVETQRMAAERGVKRKYRIQELARSSRESGEWSGRSFQTIGDAADQQLRQSADGSHSQEHQQSEGDHSFVSLEVGDQHPKLAPSRRTSGFGRGGSNRFYDCAHCKI